MTRDARRALALCMLVGTLSVPLCVGVREVVGEYKATSAKVYAAHHVGVALDSLPSWARKP